MRRYEIDLTQMISRETSQHGSSATFEVSYVGTKTANRPFSDPYTSRVIATRSPNLLQAQQGRREHEAKE